MKKWSIPLLAFAIACSTSTMTYADTSVSSNADQVALNLSNSMPIVGNTVDLHLNFSGLSATKPNLQVQTSLGTINGQSSSVTVEPTNGNYQNLSLTSTKTGTATVTVSENGVVIGSAQVTFLPDALSSVRVKVTPDTLPLGGTSIISIVAADRFGNPVADNAYGTMFSISTNVGQLGFGNGTTGTLYGNNISFTTHNGVAQVTLNSSTVGTATLTISDAQPLPSTVNLNGAAGASMITIPVNFTYSQLVNLNPIDDFNDINSITSEQLQSERELMMIGVLHGDTNHNFNPFATMKRSEFAQTVAQYMGLSSLASGFNGYPTKFADVSPTDWFNGAVAADASLGYFHGDGTYFYPNKSISYAEVAMVLLNNLGVTVSGSWPDKAITGGSTYGLFNGIGSFNANEPATRGDVAVMVRNALHLVPPTGGLSTNGKSMESELLGYTWSGDQVASVIGVPGMGVNVGNELQVTSGDQSTILHLANTVTCVGATSMNDLMGKNIKYLTNALGVVTYIEVTQ